MADITTTPVLPILALSTYGLCLCYQNITRLRQYEATTEKAAKWSETAAQQLHKTRTTQASGTVTLILSVVSATTLFLGSTSGAPMSLLRPLPVSGVNALLCVAVRIHMSRFWSGKAMVPFVERYNEAIRGSWTVRNLIGALAWAWAAAGTLAYLEIEGWLGMGVWGGVVVGSWLAELQ